MKIRWGLRIAASIVVVTLGMGLAEAQVEGSGTPGTIPKWVLPRGVSNTTKTLGDSVIQEDSTGHIGIGAKPKPLVRLAVEAVGGNVGIGVHGEGALGVMGESNMPFGTGVYGLALGDGAFAGQFIGRLDVEGNAFFLANTSFLGNVSVDGTLTKAGGSFKIDHPLDPENKYLYHSFVESPDMKNIYDGNVVTNENGEAIVTLPDYFEALNRDFRYQLTVIGAFAQAMVAQEIKDNRFTIKTSAPGVKVFLAGHRYSPGRLGKPEPHSG